MKITTRFFNFILGLSVFTQFVMLAPAHSQAFPESPTPALSESAPVQVENSNNGSAEASASKPQDSPEAGTQPSPTTSQTSATTTESQAVSETNALPTTSAEGQVPPPEVQTSPSSDPSQPTPENAQSSASENQVIPENGASQADKTSQSESSSNSKALDGLNQELNQGKNESIELDSEKRTGFSLLRSQDLADYQRTRGIWVSDSGNGRIIYMKNLRGEDFYPLGISGSGEIWVDLEGKIYVADRGNNRVVRIDNITGMGWVEMSNDFLEPRGVAFHGKRLFVSDTGNDRILVYEKFGDLTPMAELKDEKIKLAGNTEKIEFAKVVKEKSDIAILPGDLLPEEIKKDAKDKEKLEKDAKEKQETLEKYESRFTALDVPVIIDRSAQEEDELAQAEWIKVYGALFGCDEQAKKIFDEKVKEAEKNGKN